MTMTMLMSRAIVLVIASSIIPWEGTRAITLQRFTTSDYKIQLINHQLDILRGGGGRYDDEYDEYDEYDDDEYDDDEYDADNEVVRPPQRGNQTPSSRPPPPRTNPRAPPSRNRPPPPPPRRRRPPPPPKKKKESLVKKTVNLTTKTAVSSIKGTGKAAYYLATPKHVTRQEIAGVWRFDQQVGPPPDGPYTSCAANVQFTPQGDAITTYESNKHYTPYKFIQKKWPRSCTIEFEAQAFQGPHDTKPVNMFYKGYFRRKMADSGVIKIVGKIYEVEDHNKGGFWRGGKGGGGGRDGKKVLVGTFTARRRIMAPPSSRNRERRTSPSSSSSSSPHQPPTPRNNIKRTNQKYDDDEEEDQYDNDDEYDAYDSNDDEYLNEYDDDEYDSDDAYEMEDEYD